MTDNDRPLASTFDDDNPNNWTDGHSGIDNIRPATSYDALDELTTHFNIQNQQHDQPAPGIQLFGPSRRRTAPQQSSPDAFLDDHVDSGALYLTVYPSAIERNLTRIGNLEY